MHLTGILRSWNDDRGFGFIAPSHGGAEIFVHISAFPQDGSRPVEGESLFYELGRGRDNRPQAVRVVRQAIGSRPPSRQAVAKRHGTASPLKFLVAALLILACLAYGYTRFAKTANSRPPAFPVETVQSQVPAPNSFRCDGRTYCSQMTSCAEATYFLKHCPNVKMDGNNDGVPCEQQWCK